MNDSLRGQGQGLNDTQAVADLHDRATTIRADKRPP